MATRVFLTEITILTFNCHEQVIPTHFIYSSNLNDFYFIPWFTFFFQLSYFILTFLKTQSSEKQNSAS